MKKVKKKSERVIEFKSVEINEDGHITTEEVFEVSYAMYDTLHKSCPGCAVGVLSMLMTMLAIGYIKKMEEHREIFDHEDWMKYIIGEAINAVAKHQQLGATVN